MTKYVRETTPGRSISAWVIFNRKGDHVATVQAAHTNSVLVNVWNHGDKACARSAVTLGYKLDAEGKIAEGKAKGDYPYKVAGCLEGRAGGYGYDKLTAALSGLAVDGVLLTNHCSRHKAPKPPKGRKTWPSDATPPKGYRFANFADGARRYPDGSKAYHDIPDDESGYTDCYRQSGLDVLKDLGYRVLSAI